MGPWSTSAIPPNLLHCKFIKVWLRPLGICGLGECAPNAWSEILSLFSKVRLSKLEKNGIVLLLSSGSSPYDAGEMVKTLPWSSDVM